MREIKFRGKPIEDVDFDNIGVHISKDDFVYGNLIVDGSQAWIVKGVIESTNDYITLEQWIPVRPSTVGQSTGLYDKNGKEIWGGDIVLFEGGKHTIIYCDYYAMFMAKMSEHYRISLFECESSLIEVIGNIHDKE